MADTQEINVIAGRIQGPVIDGKRTEIHPITDADAVIYQQKTADGSVKTTTVADVIGQVTESVVVSKPDDVPKHSCLWVQDLS